jgi:3-oxoacyl-(acyl-carrier-protein) synthase/acyl carrier protein
LPNSILGAGVDPVADIADFVCHSVDLAEGHKIMEGSISNFEASVTEKSGLKCRIFAAVTEFMVKNHFDISKLSMLHFFSTSGMDSLELLELADYISRELDINLEPTCLIDYPCVQALYNHICGDTDLAPLQEHVSVDLDSARTVMFLRSNHSMGIFNSSRRIPTSKVGGISKICLCMQDSVKSVPIDRWDPETAQRQSREVWVPRFGSFLENVDMFDAQAWRISIVEAAHMDPQQRLLLEVTAHTLPFPSFAVPQSQQVGVFVGASSTDYDDELKLKVAQMKERSPYALTGGSLSVLSGRIAYQFGLQGPALVTDTACSSSMVSAGIALDMLRQNRINDAICGSVNVMLSPSRFLFFAAAGMLSECGRSKTLDEAADGFSRGEAVVCFLIKDIAHVDQGAHYELECLLGSISINQDGRSSTLSSPNGPAQTSLIQKAMQEATCSPEKVLTLCLHGTGTPLGDPIEVNAAFKALMSEGEQSTGLFLVAPKTLLSHSEASAGAVSILFTIQQARTSQSLVVEHLRSINNHVKPLLMETFNNGKPTVIPRQNHGWNTLQGSPLAAVSCFASQGTNSHAILEPLIKDNIGLSSTFTRDKERMDLRWCKVLARVFPSRCSTKPIQFRSSRMKQRVEAIDQSDFFQGHKENFLLHGHALLFQV